MYRYGRNEGEPAIQVRLRFCPFCKCVTVQRLIAWDGRKSSGHICCECDKKIQPSRAEPESA